MKKSLSKAEMKSYLKRWAAVKKAEIEELRRTSKSRKFYQFLSLTASPELFIFPASNLKETASVRARWQRLRRYSQVVKK